MRGVSIVSVVGWLVPGTAIADFDTSTVPPWEICALCHGIDGVSRTARFPKLAAQPIAYLEKQVRDFRGGHRMNDGGQMVAIVEAEITEDQISKVAGWFANQPPPAATDVDYPDKVLAGQRLYSDGDAARGIAACVSCHGKGAVAASGAPRLESQWAPYITKQLEEFSTGERANDAGGVMRQTAQKLTDEERESVGLYLQTRPWD